MRTIATICATAACALIAAPASAATLNPVLRIDASSAPVRTDVGYTITVTPAKKAVGKRARIQVKGIVAWRGFDTFRIPKSGVIKDDVEGFQPGVGNYRVLILSKSGHVLAKSNTATVTWTPKK